MSSSIDKSKCVARTGHTIGRVGACFVLPLSVLILAILYTSIPTEKLNDLVREISQQHSKIETKSSSKPPPVQSSKKEKEEISKSVEETFLDRFNLTRLNEFIDIRIMKSNDSNQHHMAADDRLPLKIEDLNRFIRGQLLPRLNSIVSMDYFRYIKLNLKRKCTLWPDDTRCSLK